MSSSVCLVKTYSSGEGEGGVVRKEEKYAPTDAARGCATIVACRGRGCDRRDRGGRCLRLVEAGGRLIQQGGPLHQRRSGGGRNRRLRVSQPGQAEHGDAGRQLRTAGGASGGAKLLQVR